jgi:hypothetical protein
MLAQYLKLFLNTDVQHFLINVVPVKESDLRAEFCGTLNFLAKS